MQGQLGPVYDLFHENGNVVIEPQAAAKAVVRCALSHLIFLKEHGAKWVKYQTARTLLWVY